MNSSIQYKENIQRMKRQMEEEIKEQLMAAQSEEGRSQYNRLLKVFHQKSRQQEWGLNIVV